LNNETATLMKLHKTDDISIYHAALGLPPEQRETFSLGARWMRDQILVHADDRYQYLALGYLYDAACKRYLQRNCEPETAIDGTVMLITTYREVSREDILAIHSERILTWIPVLPAGVTIPSVS
jgi:hypothetical protein